MLKALPLVLSKYLDIAVEEERYEDAAKIRDYLKK